MADRPAEDLRSVIPDLLAAPAPVRVPDGSVDRRAAVTLLLSPEGPRERGAEALLVVRAEVEGDPWSGHVALPGGRAEPGDEDLMHTALRELAEETGLDVPREEVLGRLDDLHPRSAHLPSIAVTPFVAWMGRRAPLVESEELAGHVWVPLADLAAPGRRSTLVREPPDGRTFETIEYAGVTVWGMTLSIIDNFLRRLREGP